MSGRKGASNKGRFNKDLPPTTPTERIAWAKDAVIAAARRVAKAYPYEPSAIDQLALRSRIDELDELVGGLKRAHPDWRLEG